MSSSVGRWRVDRWRGPAGEAHGRPWPPAPVAAVRLVEATEPAVVLGSTQQVDVVDESLARERGVSVVQRRSGGGAVLVGTGDVVWVDVFVPAGDARWDRDVGRATHWLGQAWVDTLASLGIGAEWHDGPLVVTAWSPLVCFAGLGPGEVRVGRTTAGGPGAKIVGISQRRIRAGALFQCAALLAWDPAPILEVLALDGAERSQAEKDLAGAAVGIVDIAGDAGAPTLPTAVAVEDAFVHRLSSV